MALVGIETSPAPPHLTLSGEIDLAVAPDLQERGAELAKAVAPGELEVDLADVTFIDSSGLGALISLRNTARTCGANLRLVRLSSAVQRFFELAGVQDSFRLG